MILGIGTDIIEIDRIKRSIDRFGKKFINQIFNPEEIHYVSQFKNQAQHFAVRFAAKEAVFKAVSNDKTLSWKDITIINDKNGKPTCKLNRKNFKNKILLSLSHSKNYAVASAIITNEK